MMGDPYGEALITHCSFCLVDDNERSKSRRKTDLYDSVSDTAERHPALSIWVRAFLGDALAQYRLTCATKRKTRVHFPVERQSERVFPPPSTQQFSIRRKWSCGQFMTGNLSTPIAIPIVHTTPTGIEMKNGFNKQK